MSKRSNPRPHPTTPSAGPAAPAVPTRPPARRLAALAAAGLALGAGALWVRVHAGDRDRELQSLTTPQLAALAHLSPDDELTHYYLGSRLLAEKRFAAAKGEFDAAVRLDPQSSRARVGLAQALGATGKLADAELELQQAIKLDSRNVEAELAMAKLLFSEGRKKDALPHVLRATTLDPTNDEAWFGAANCYAGMHDDTNAIKCLRHAVEIRETTAVYHVSLAQALVRVNRLEEALQQGERAVQLDPENGDACALTGDLLAKNSSDPASLKRAEELLIHATGLTTARPPEVWFDLGQLYVQTARMGKAVEAFGQAIKIDPRDERFYYALEGAYRRAGDAARAAQTHVFFVRISALHTRWDRLLALVTANPNDPARRLDLARVERDLGLLPQAAQQYSAYLRMTPQDSVVRRELQKLVDAANAARNPPAATPPLSPGQP